jgi:hypothetical protein
MPLDPSIPLQARNVQLPNVMEIQGNAMKLRQLQQQSNEYDRQARQRDTIANLYRTNIDASGNVNASGITQGLAREGYGDQIPEFQKGQADYGKALAGMKGEQLAFHLKQVNAVNGVLGSLLSQPNITHDDVIAKVSGLVDDGIIDNNAGAAIVKQLPGPGQLRPFLMQRAIEGLDNAQQVQMLLPKYDEQDTGGAINQGTINPLTGVRTAGVDVQKTITPGEMLASNTAKELGAVTYQQDARGNFVALPTKPGAGPIRSTAVLDANGNPQGGKGTTLNDGQSKALLFGSRARDANAVLEGLASKGVNMGSVPKAVAEGVPVVGRALGAIANATMVSPEQQQAEQAKDDFIHAVLRRESGATIMENEYNGADKQYFPQIGDLPGVLAQKARNRALAIQGILAEVPEGQRDSLNTSANGATANPGAPALPANVNRHEAPSGNQLQPAQPETPPKGPNATSSNAPVRPPLSAIFGKPR